MSGWNDAGPGRKRKTVNEGGQTAAGQSVDDRPGGVRNREAAVRAASRCSLRAGTVKSFRKGSKILDRTGRYKKMLKMKDEPTMCMKTQERMTRCRAIKPAFYTKMLPLHDHRQQSLGLIGSKIRRSRDNWLRSWEWHGCLARVTAWPGWPCHKDWTPAFAASTERDRVPSDASVKASHDVSETKGVTRRMARNSSQSMLLKSKLLSDSYVVRVTAKNPPENRRAKPECC